MAAILVTMVTMVEYVFFRYFPQFSTLLDKAALFDINPWIGHYLLSSPSITGAYLILWSVPAFKIAVNSISFYESKTDANDPVLSPTNTWLLGIAHAHIRTVIGSKLFVLDITSCSRPLFTYLAHPRSNAVLICIRHSSYTRISHYCEIGKRR